MVKKKLQYSLKPSHPSETTAPRHMTKVPILFLPVLLTIYIARPKTSKNMFLYNQIFKDLFRMGMQFD